MNEELKSKVSVIVFIAILIGVGFLILSNFRDILPSTEDSATDAGVYTTTKTLNPVMEGITSLTAKAYNRTWIDCDGVNDLFAFDITTSRAVLTYWYKNATTNWTSVILNGEDEYVNGVSATAFKPYYLSGDTYTFCKTDATTFLNVSIDEVRVYETKLTALEVAEVYADGR